MRILALDTETTGLGYWDEAFCVSWAFRSTEGDLESGVEYLPDGMEQIHSLLDHPTEALVFHNAKFDLQKLKLAGITLPLHIWTYEIHDTECMSHLLNEQQPKALKRLAKDILGLETDEDVVLRDARRKLKLRKSDGYQSLPREILEPYARKDAEFTLLLYEYFYPQISSEPDLERLYREEQELAEVLMDLEEAGLGVDVKYVESMAKELAGEVLKTDLAIRDMVGVEEFNPGSWQQITAALKERGIEVGSTSKAVLRELDDELAQAILKLRHDSKLYNTYFKPLLHEQRDGVMHPNFKQWGTRGRRFSAGENDG